MTIQQAEESNTLNSLNCGFAHLSFPNYSYNLLQLLQQCQIRPCCSCHLETLLGFFFFFKFHLVKKKIAGIPQN